MARVVILGSAHPFRGGGITTFNHRLAKEFTDLGHECSIFSFSLQYPSFLFPGKSQYTDEPAPGGIRIVSVINSINPLNWIRVGNKLRKMRPDIIVVRFWLPFMGPAFGTILRRARKNRVTRVICIADNIKPHERRPGDKVFTRYFLKSCDAFVVMSQRVLGDLQALGNRKPAILVPHPLYDNFGAKIGKSEARQYLGLPDDDRLILFFGFIRRYKGLDLLLEAIKLLKEKYAGDNKAFVPPKVLISGEFYEDEKNYRALIEKWGLKDELFLRTDFIPDNEVKYYICAADAIIQPYRSATQSGVTPLAYHYEKPMIVTNVGGLPDLVPDEKAGLIVEPNAVGIAGGIVKFYELGGEDFFIQHLRSEKKKYSWSGMVNTIIQLANDLQK